MCVYMYLYTYTHYLELIVSIIYTIGQFSLKDKSFIYSKILSKK